MHRNNPSDCFRTIKQSNNENISPVKATIKSVPEAGIEPALPYGKQILSLSCLPIPPLGHWTRCLLLYCFIFTSCTKRNNIPTDGVDYQQLMRAQQAWMQGHEGAFIEIVESQRVGKEIFYATAAREYAKRGRWNWSLEDLTTSKQYALRCLGEDHHVQILLRNEHGLLTLKAIQALDMENDSLVACATWLTIAWSLQLHHRKVSSAHRDIELLYALGQWLQTIPKMRNDPWVLYAAVVSGTLVSSPDWVQISNRLDQLMRLKLDGLLPFERILLERTVVERDVFCATDIGSYGNLSSGQQERWLSHQYLCSR